MTEKIYLETFEKCPGSVYFPLLMHFRVSPLSYTSNTKTILPQTWSLLTHLICLL